MDERVTTDNQWFYSNGKERLGSFSKGQMLIFIKEGKVSYGTQVWCKGLADWCSVEHTELRSYLEEIAPPPLTGDKVNNTVIWVLAFAPLLGLFLEAVVAYSLYGDSYRAEQALNNNQFWYITLVLNIALGFWDEQRLKKAGHNTDKFKGWAWLVPVYLFQRAKALKQNYAYFVVWIICCILMLGA